MTPETYEKIRELEQEISNLQYDLISPVSPIGDWKIAKYQEYSLIQRTVPYDINELHEKRQTVRDRINELRAEIETLSNS